MCEFSRSLSCLRRTILIILDVSFDISVSVPFSSIYKYVDKACERSRCLIECEAVYDAGHVVECAVEAVNGDRITVAALVLQTSGLANPPHNVSVVID